MHSVPNAEPETGSSAPQTHGSRPPQRRQAVACIESLAYSHDLLSYAVVAAEALDADLTLLHVVPPHTDFEGPHDPISTNLKRQEAAFKIERIAKNWECGTGAIKAAVLEGQPADQIYNWARSHRVDLTILFSRLDGAACESSFGVTSQKIIDKMPGSVLIVPESSREERPVSLKKLLILLDGSVRAESALPIAIQLSESKKAELVLVHAVPQPELTEIGPIEAEDEELKAKIVDHNEKKATAYLNRLQSQFTDKSFPTSVRILKGGDVRRLLQQTIIQEDADMVVISSHGQGGYPDVTTGSVARFLMGHMHAPLFIVRDSQERAIMRDVALGTAKLRFPDNSAA